MKYPHFYQLACKKVDIPTREWERFEASFRKVDYKKGDLLLSPDEEADTIYCVISGVLRNYFVHSNGREFTKIFRGPGTLVGPYAEILTGTKTKYFIQATVPSQVIQFSYRFFSSLMEESHHWEKLGRKFAEDNYLEKERREYMLIHMNIEEKYAEFIKDFEKFKDSIPQYQIASYLGVSPEALNRFLKVK